jgi:phytoene dehydrogenase-like protein
VSRQTVDAVVVGAGHNGLVAANILADAGWDVLVLESSDSPGGAVRTAEVTAPGFANDLCSAFYPLGGASPVMRRLELESYGLRWRHAPQVLAHLFPDDRCAVLSRDLDQTAASLGAFDPADAQAWREECALWRRVGPVILDALFGPFPPVRSGLRLARLLGTADAVRFARFATLSARRFAEERFRGEGARLLIAGNALHTDLSPDGAGGAVFGWLLAMLGQHVGFPVPEGGAGRITDALVNRLAARGGRVECGRRVERVVVRRGRAIGVRDTGGGAVLARRAVLAAVPAPLLYGGLVESRHLPVRLLDDLRRFQWDSAVVKVDWALSGRVPWKAPEVADAGTVHLGADMAGLIDYAADLAKSRLPADPFVLLGQMTTADPSRSPAGTESLWAYTHVPVCGAGDGWDRGEADRTADRLTALLERHAPGFADLVLDRAVHVPAGRPYGDPGLSHGSVNAGTAGIHQQLVFRPVPGLARADTPVDRLYLAGASAHPGGGVHGGPGGNAARAALVRSGAAGELYAAGIRAAHRLIY